MKTALTIAGSDSSGGAGIQADLKAMTMNGVFAMSAITALTAQNTTGVQGIFEVTPAFLGQQIDSVFTDIRPDAVKIGMVASSGLIEVIAERLQHYAAQNIVVDPVMVATSGARLISEDAIATLEARLLPLATVLTPNIPEAEVLSGLTIASPDDMIAAGKAISERYGCAVLCKGGHRLNDANDHYHILGGETRDADIEKTLLGLGFRREDFDRPTSEFSGGWRMRIELAKLLLKSPDVLLLDEPTNHLDIESIGWLEDFICNSSKAVVVISHDRKFVDDITTRTIEVTMGRIYDYKATYSQYLELRKERREQQMKQYEEQQKMIADTKEFIERFKGTYSKTLQVQSRVKMLEKLQLIEVDEEDTSRLRLKFPPSPRSGAYPVQMSDVAMSFDGKNVFSGVNLTVERGDKIAFVGRNGEGKSTLVKCIMGQLQNEGKLELGHNVQIGYFAQNQASLLDGELTVFQTIDDVAKGDVRNKIRDLLGAFMFGGEESTKKVKVLSGGERTRLAILKLLLEPVNLLILDEPTNHLDLKTKDVLKQALLDFDGTLIVVSHDRDFLDGLVSKVYEFGHGRVREHLCGIYEFLESKKMESLQELERNRVKLGKA